MIEFKRRCVLVTGPRAWIERKAIWDRLRTHHPLPLSEHNAPSADVLLHGAAGGADTQAGDFGLAMGFIVEPTPYFGEFGKAGGPRRNALLLDKLLTYGRHGYAMYVEAFLLPRPQAVGTRDMLDRVQRAINKGAAITVHETHQE